MFVFVFSFVFVFVLNCCRLEDEAREADRVADIAEEEARRLARLTLNGRV